MVLLTISKSLLICELIARVKRQLNHLLKKQTGKYFFAILNIDFNDNKIRLILHFSKKEFFILDFIVSHAGKLVMQNTILKDVWGECHGDGTQHLRVYIEQLRKKLFTCKKNKTLNNHRKRYRLSLCCR
ncbi:winged helix-turn-helix domain-containing protein [Francisella persica]|uniref:winged helix-turn-helix domain-containing protein n=1 Tax=Francisella persica TaxID=954 RepID=UPI000B2CC551|nr:winged helix-turn-helix domain-containing protein [Francisella persica]